jgi:hypothetical protein
MPPFDKLSQKSQLNCICDLLAKQRISELAQLLFGGRCEEIQEKDVRVCQCQLGLFWQGTRSTIQNLDFFWQFSCEFLILKGRTHLKISKAVNFTGPQPREK